MLSCLLTLAACAGSIQDIPTVQIDGLVIENQTPAWVSAVRILVPATGGFVSCGNIAPDSMCSTGFPERAYTGSPIEITWSQAGQIHSTGQFVMHLPADLDMELTAAVRVVITGPGSAGAILVQHQP